MVVNLSLGDLFYETWGYRSAAFEGEVPDVVGLKVNRRKETGDFGSPYYAVNALGREYYLPIEVQVGNDNAEALGVKNADGSNSGRWMLPHAIVTGSIEKSFHFVDTEVTEREGLVSELISTNSFKVNVKGFLINKNNEFPEDDFITLNRLVDLKKVVRINNVVTDVLFMKYNGNKTVTMRNLRFMGQPGVKHVLPYELELWGDVPFNLVEIV